MDTKPDDDMKHDLGAVLVVGGCGYLGSHLVSLLHSEQPAPSVHVLSRNPNQNLHPAATYHAIDIANTEQVSTIFDKIQPRVVFHMATPKYTASEKLLRQTNFDGTRNLLQCAARTPSVRAFVYTGTDSAVVQAPGIKLDEERAELYTEESRINAYAKTKAIAEREVLAANSPELRTAVIRIPGLYGENDDNCMGSLLNAVKKGQHKMQVGNNKRSFEFVYVENACKAHILAARALVGMTDNDTEQDAGRSTKGRVDGEAFFVSDGISLPYFGFARKVYAFAGHPVAEDEIKVIPHWLVLGFAILGEWVAWAFRLKTPDVSSLGIKYLAGGCEWDISKAKERLGYKPVEDQDEVIKKVAQSEAKRLGV
jgi:sterol-4alpha-carboxylate 3-dehydrogenase (decarboxylating)